MDMPESFIEGVSDGCERLQNNGNHCNSCLHMLGYWERPELTMTYNESKEDKSGFFQGI